MNIQIVFLLAVLAVIAGSITDARDQRERQIDADAIYNSVVQLAAAQTRFVADPDNTPFGAYATTPQQLVTAGYLPVWSDDPNFTFGFPGANGFVINYAATSEGAAAEILVRFGETAVISGTTVTVGFADAVELALFDAFVRKAGDEMFGALNMRAGSGANINMNDNDINSQGNITVKNATGTANIDTDTANAGSLTVQTFRVVN